MNAPSSQPIRAACLIHAQASSCVWSSAASRSSSFLRRVLPEPALELTMVIEVSARFAHSVPSARSLNDAVRCHTSTDSTTS